MLLFRSPNATGNSRASRTAVKLACLAEPRNPRPQSVLPRSLDHRSRTRSLSSFGSFGSLSATPMKNLIEDLRSEHQDLRLALRLLLAVTASGRCLERQQAADCALLL